MKTTKLDKALEQFKAAREAAIKSGIPAIRLDGSLVNDGSAEARQYNRATFAVDRAAKAAYATHNP